MYFISTTLSALLHERTSLSQTLPILGAAGGLKIPLDFLLIPYFGYFLLIPPFDTVSELPTSTHEIGFTVQMDDARITSSGDESS